MRQRRSISRLSVASPFPFEGTTCLFCLLILGKKNPEKLKIKPNNKGRGRHRVLKRNYRELSNKFPQPIDGFRSFINQNLVRNSC